MLNEETKKFIEKELSTEKGRVQEYTLNNVESKIYCFELALNVSENLERLSNLKNSIVDQLNAMAEDSSKLNLETFQKVAQFLEIFIYLQDKDFYNSIQGYKGSEEQEEGKKLTEEERKLKENQKMINSLSIPEALKKLGILDNIDYDLLRKNYTKQQEYSKFSEELKTYANVYYLRNQVSHADRDLSVTQKWQYVKDILMIYLDIAGRFRKELEEELNRIDLSAKTKAKEYMDTIIKKYEERPSFEYITLEGKEQKNREASSKTSLINLISKKSNCRVKLLGNAGMGKTTTMEYLAYQDAKNFNGRVPVFVELKDINNEQDTIIKIVANKEHLDCSEETVEKLLSNGYINLYLDGINEIQSDNNKKRQIVSQINLLFTTYPKIKVILTDRESNNITVTDNVDIYIIEKLSDTKIEEFIRKNSNTKDLENKVNALVFDTTPDSKNLKELVRVPFRLYKLIEIVNMGMTIPKNIEEFDKYFTDAIIEREVRQKATPEARNISYFLKEIIKLNFDVYERDDLIEIISDAINKRNLSNENSDKIVDLIVQLGIMEEVSFNNYRFINAEIRRTSKELKEEKQELEEISW